MAHGLSPAGVKRVRDDLVEDLLQYAKQKVEDHRFTIAANLESSVQLPLVVDIALPGAGYDSVAAGGMAEVLHLLGEELIQVDRFIGASGGACSMFLILANGFIAPSYQPKVTSTVADKANPSSDAGSGSARSYLTCGVCKGGRGGGGKSSARSGGPSKLGEGQCPSSKLLLQSYLEYSEAMGNTYVHKTMNSILQGFHGMNSYWENLYWQVLQNESAWATIQERAYVAACAKPLRSAPLNRLRALGHVTTKTKDLDMTHSTVFGSNVPPIGFETKSDNYIFHHFEDRTQAVQAFVASGEATLKGFTSGIDVMGAAEKGHIACRLLDDTGSKSSAPLQIPSHFCDGGSPVLFGHLPEGNIPSRTVIGSMTTDKSKNGFLYYHTYFSNPYDAMVITQQSVTKLFKSAVDRTIECLSNESFSSPLPGCYTEPDRMVVVMPGRNPMNELGKIRCHESLGLKGGCFVNLQSGDMFEACAHD